MLVHLHTILQRQTPEGVQRRLEVNLPSGSTLATLLISLDLPLSVEHLLLTVNRRVAEGNYVLAEGDEVNIMPALSGGGC